MLTLVSEAWKQNKTRVLLVAIPVIAMLLGALFMKGWRSWLIASAEKLLKKTKEKDSSLKKEADELDSKANEHKQKADKLKQEAQSIEDDKDWHKK
jgi:sortase (surface protein transpeptidase)